MLVSGTRERGRVVVATTATIDQGNNALKGFTNRHSGKGRVVGLVASDVLRATTGGKGTKLKHGLPGWRYGQQTRSGFTGNQPGHFSQQGHEE